MSYKHFSLSVIVHACLLAITPLIVVLIWPYEKLFVFRFLLAFIYIIQVISLIRLVRKTNRELARFIESFGFGDTTIHFHTSDKDTSFQDLFQSFNQVVKAFRQLKLDKEKEYLFFETALKKIGVAIIVVNEHGNVTMTNEALLRLLNIKYLHRLDKLNSFKPGLSDELMQLQPNQQKLIELMVNNRMLQVALTSVLMKKEDKMLRLLAFQDIRSEIEQKELESWQKLIRVLTHEVMNSLSPINILSAGLKERFQNSEAPISIDDEEQSEIIEGLNAIHTRSKGLTSFVESYRSMAGLKSAQTQPCNIYQILLRIQALYAKKGNAFELTVNCEKQLSYLVDEKLLEQSLINLVKNSIEALDKHPAHIAICAQIKTKKLQITIHDNGKGIPEEELDKVCVPFYTTRHGGSGIGLALSQQVMRLHGGNLKIHSEIEKGTTVLLNF
ncbi:ATP-binding protein [Carboxylicivirga sp. A043]|uniref:sensor histidine kinase n=1 Tax=Carboxylicivirga litoralis TaxID=2816963 RepID=UPI0021CAF5BA|nr:ATP-binding protein [Carboxylicivirga sp. A043]MCU4156532.1 ATP-binding protein [Carboxylicivirga sp. A043]